MAKIQPVDKVEILILVDNYVDVLLPGNDFVQRPALAKEGKIGTETLVAEHGLCLLITVHMNGESHSVLLDAGYNGFSLRHNLRLLDLPLDRVEAVVVSHGHMDHTGGLETVLEDMKRPVKVIVHPDAFAKRFADFPDRGKVTFPTVITREKLKLLGADVVESTAPLSLADDSMLVTGSVPRVTGFEKGFVGALKESGGKLVPDSIEDDQAIVVNIKDKGLVVISGCAHSGIINTLLYARELTGEARVHAVIGGFHLVGPDAETLVSRTVEEMKSIAPEVIVPMHCTGWASVRRIAAEFPGEFVTSSVGTKLVLPKSSVA
ncbi:MAG: MBL fold metallo-hydrolase [Pseudomonadota bacterium]